ncbi:MAG: 2-oxoglutarate dehydrogenase complex dihydrolipoyllysine-residue succinyltransferase [Bacteroidia bacterium]
MAEIKIPNVGESITEVTISKWLKEDGDFVEMDEAIAEIESDKASFEVNAEVEGILKIKSSEGETVNIGTVIADIQPGEGGAEKEKQKKDKSTADKEDTPAADKAEKKEQQKETPYASGHASPAAAKILREKGISPEDVNGSGKDGRITKEDAENAEAKKEKSDQKAEKPDSATEKAPDSKKESKPAKAEKSRPEERNTHREKLSTLRKTIAKRLVEAKNQTAMLTTFNEVDMGNIMELRKKFKDKFKEKHEVGLGFMSFFAKAVCLAIEEFPKVNASLDGEELEYHDYVDMGIAVSTERGLVVPVVRNTESMSMAEIEQQIIDKAVRARDNKLGIDEMQGGTFTITNGGIFGSMLSTPILNPPQSAILGMHNIVERAVVINGEIKIRPVMFVALSYDHRVIDGRESVSFLLRVKEYLEDPARMLIGI